MIYRAICYCIHERLIDTPESVVFIQGSTRDETGAKLRRVLADIWQVPVNTVDFYNLNDALELFADALGGPDSGDARLFEMGAHGNSPLYLDDDAPLLLLELEANKRLLQAWKTVCATRQAVAGGKF